MTTEVFEESFQESFSRVVQDSFVEMYCEFFYVRVNDFYWFLTSAFILNGYRRLEYFGSLRERD